MILTDETRNSCTHTTQLSQVHVAQCPNLTAGHTQQAVDLTATESETHRPTTMRNAIPGTPIVQKIHGNSPGNAPGTHTPVNNWAHMFLWGALPGLNSPHGNFLNEAHTI